MYQLCRNMRHLLKALMKEKYESVQESKKNQPKKINFYSI